MILVTGISRDLSSPKSDSNDGVCDAHDEQWKTVYKYNDDNMVTARNKKNTCWRAYWNEIVRLWIHSTLNHNWKCEISTSPLSLISQIHQNITLLLPTVVQMLPSNLCQFLYTNTIAELQCSFKFHMSPCLEVQAECLSPTW